VSPWATDTEADAEADGWALAAPVADTVGRGEADGEDDGDGPVLAGRGGTLATVGGAATAASTGLAVQGEAAVPPHPADVVCGLAAVRPDAAPGDSRLLAR
jgi:hypothetical protein